MVQLIVGKKGKGKTKQLLDKVNSEVKDISGSIVYLDKSTKHMYELNNKVRLIDVSRYMIENESEFQSAGNRKEISHVAFSTLRQNPRGETDSLCFCNDFIGTQ